MISQEEAQELGVKWIEACNNHSVDDFIFLHNDDIIFTSPFVSELMGEESGTISGKERLKSHFNKVIDAYPDLKFELYHVLTGVYSMVIYYESINELVAAAVITLDTKDKIINTVIHFSEKTT